MRAPHHAGLALAAVWLLGCEYSTAGQPASANLGVLRAGGPIAMTQSPDGARGVSIFGFGAPPGAGETARNAF